MKPTFVAQNIFAPTKVATQLDYYLDITHILLQHTAYTDAIAWLFCYRYAVLLLTVLHIYCCLR